MKKNNIGTCLIFLFLCLIGSSLSFAEVKKKDKDSSSFQSEGVEISIRVSKNSKTYKDLTNSIGWIWGSDGNKPNEKVDGIILLYKKHKVEVPKFVYFDLFEPAISTCSFYKEKGGDHVLVFDGGDAAASYRVKLFFKNGFFTKREIIHLVAPNRKIIESIELLASDKKRVHPKDAVTLPSKVDK